MAPPLQQWVARTRKWTHKIAYSAATNNRYNPTRAPNQLLLLPVQAQHSVVRFANTSVRHSKVTVATQRVSDLISSSKLLLRSSIESTTGTSSGGNLGEWFQLFSGWHHELFQIPQHNHKLLHEVAEIINELICRFLNDQPVEAISSDQKLVLDLLCTGIFAWGRVSRFDSRGPEKAEALFHGFVKLLAPESLEHPLDKVKGSLVYCWSQAIKNQDAPERAKFWMESILERKGAVIETITFNAVLRAYAHHGKVDDVLSLLDVHPEVALDPYSYESLVVAWYRSKRPEGSREALVALQLGIEVGLSRDDTSPLPLLCGRFLTLSRDDPTLVEGTLSQLLELEKEHPDLELVQSRDFVMALAAWASKGEFDHVQRLFRQMEALYEKGNVRLQPSYHAFCVVLDGLLSNKETRNALTLAESLLKTIETVFIESKKPNVDNHAYNILLDAYARVLPPKERKERVQGLLAHMTHQARQYGNSSLMPDKVSYTALIRALGNERSKSSLHQSFELLEFLEGSDDERLHPDAKLYTMVFSTWLNRDDTDVLPMAHRLATRIRKRHAEGLSSVQMDRFMYTALMKCCSQTRDVGRSDHILGEMMQEYALGNNFCSPDETAFLTAMGTWARSGRPDSMDGALRLYNQMLSAYKAGNENCKPTNRVYGQLFVILCGSQQSTGKLRMAESLRRSMEQFDVLPNRSVLNWYLRVCGSECDDKEEAWKCAKGAFDMLNKPPLTPDSISFSTMILAASNLIEDPKQKLSSISDTFHLCSQNSLVDGRVIQTMKRVLGPEEFQRLVSSHKDTSGTGSR